MRNRSLLSRIPVLAILIALFAAVALAKEPVKEQTWSFQGHQGRVKIRASQFERDTDQRPFVALDLWVEDGRSNIQEECRFLSFALAELPKSGFDLLSLSHLLFRLDQTDADERLAPFAARSRRWNSVARSHSAQVTYPAVTEMLNDSGAFKEWFDLFRANGIDARVAGIEKLGMTNFQETGATCPATLNCSRVLVPATALVQVDFQPIQQH